MCAPIRSCSSRSREAETATFTSFDISLFLTLHLLSRPPNEDDVFPSIAAPQNRVSTFRCGNSLARFHFDSILSRSRPRQAISDDNSSVPRHFFAGVTKKPSTKFTSRIHTTQNYFHQNAHVNLNFGFYIFYIYHK